MSLKEKVINGMGWALVDKLFSQLSYFTITVYLARIIGPEGYGLIAMLAIFAAIAGSLVDSGLCSALVQRSQKVTEADASTVFYTNLVMATLTYVALYLAAPLIAVFYKQPELVEVARVAFCVLLIDALALVSRAKLVIALDFKKLAVVSIFTTGLSAAFALWLAIKGYGYWALVWQSVSKSVLGAVGLWIVNRWRPQWIFSFESLTSLFKFGSNLLAAGLVATLVNNLYALFIGRLFAPVQVGYFSQAYNLSNYLSGLISASLHGVTYPVLTSIKEDRERLVRIYRQLISNTMMISLPVLVGFAAVSHDFVSLFLGDAWLPMAPVVSMLCFARSVTAISAINMNILNAIGRSDLFLKVDLTKLPLTLGPLFLAVPYGIEVLAGVLTVTSFIAFFINAYYPGRIFGFGGLSQLKIMRSYILASAAIYFCVKQLPVGDGFFDFTLKVGLGFFVYCGVLILLRDQYALDLFRVAVLAFRRRMS